MRLPLSTSVIKLVAIASAGLILGACSTSSSGTATTSSTTAGAEPRFAFAEISFSVSGKGEIRNVKVIASDAPEALQQRAVSQVRGYVLKPDTYNQKARQTFIFTRKTGEIVPMPIAVHSSQRPNGG